MKESVSPVWTSSALLHEMQKGDSLFIVAVADGNETGNSSLCAQDREPSPVLLGFAVFRQVGDDGELLQIAVDKSARRKGVGGLLLRAALDYAGDNMLKSVFLEVRESNEAAVRLYKKHGFSLLRVRKDYYDSPSEDALVMKRVLE